MKKMTIGKIVRKIRRDKDLTQGALAKMAGISQVTVSRLECGVNKPNLATLKVIASALRISFKELTEE